VRQCFAYAYGEDRATGYLYGPGQDWPVALAAAAPGLLGRLYRDTGVVFTLAAFQAYRNGTGCGWHADTPFGAQAILSLGVTRTFGARRTVSGAESWYRLAHGDLVFMPRGFQDGWEHCVPEERVPGERCSLVFREPV
jgi:alkylated DNA repair dioxygenase AlkB